MANYQTDFLTALGMASDSLGGLMKDIRKPTFQEEVLIREQSQARLNQQQQNFLLEAKGVDQDYHLERMDKGLDIDIEKMTKQTDLNLKEFKGQTMMQFTDAKNRDAYFNRNPERAKDVQDIEQALKDGDYEYIKKNFQKITNLNKDIEKAAVTAGHEVREQSWVNFFTQWLPGGGFGYRGSQKIEGDEARWKNDLQIDLEMKRRTKFRELSRDFQQVDEVLAQAGGVSTEWSKEHSDVQKGLNTYYENIDWSDPIQTEAAFGLMSMQNQGLYANMMVQNQKAMAMNNVLGSGATPEYSIKDIVEGAGEEVSNDKWFGRRSAGNVAELATVQKNSFQSSLGLSALQANYALNDKFEGINGKRQKEALADLVEAKTLAEKLSNQSFGNMAQKDADQMKAYYGESRKMIDSYIRALKA
tara:strand:- start:289 stop:1536 length:1248 start_codon:yes stop_codon:yes gene_type:complete